jgi:lipoyl(octanoyl) transferase
MPNPILWDLGTKEYSECLKLQHHIHGARVKGLLPDTLLLVEHPHVLTFGRRANEENVLVSESALQQMGVTCVHIERGGDVTFHGPGQLVSYPIFGLKKKGIAVLDFVERLEEVMIRVLKDCGIEGERDPRNRGVWVGNRKIGFVGIAVKKGVSFHGLALNVNPDFQYFQLIHPCGLKNVQVDSMARLLKEEVPQTRIKDLVVFHFQEIFDITLEPWTDKDFQRKAPFLGSALQPH